MIGIQRSDAGDVTWKLEPFQSPDGPEYELQSLIEERPDVTPWQELGIGSAPVILRREVTTVDGKSIDHLALDSQGQVYIFECKIVTNHELRSVIAQALEYAAQLEAIGTTEEFLTAVDKSWEDLDLLFGEEGGSFRKGAAQQYAGALRVSPGNPMLHYYLGTTLMGLHSDEDAAEHYQAAIRSNPGFKEAHFQQANLLMRLQRYEKAIPHYATVVELDAGLGAQILPGDSGDGQLLQMNGLARFMQAMALIRLSRYVEELAVLEEGLEVFPGQADMTHALARLLAACPDHKIRNGGRALQLLKPLFEGQDGLDLESVETLAMALAETGQFERAVQVQRAMISDLEGNQRFDLARLLADNLALYECGQPCRLPWREDDPVFSPVPAAMEPLGPATNTRP